MDKLKMKDVFGKEVHFNTCNGTLNDPVDYGEWAEFNSEEALVAAAHAINSHDNLVEEIAALKAYAAKGDEEIKRLTDEIIKEKTHNLRDAWMIGRFISAMQAACIETDIDESIVGYKKGMQWIFNSLSGPGFYPENEKNLTPQEWFDEQMKDEPLNYEAAVKELMNK